jgi:hypothetical protein
VGDVRIRYYVTRQQPGRRKWGYWSPCLARPNKKTGQSEPTLMAALGFRHVDCGEDGPLAWAIAQSWNERWDLARAAHERGELVPGPSKIERSYLPGSFGEGFCRFRATRTWLKKKPRTREDWERGWRHIETMFGDVDPKTVALEHVDQWYALLLEKVGVREAHRAMKIWRALWRVIATMRTASGAKYCERDHDPSLGVRRETPAPRQAIWFEGEAVRLVKRAWRMGYHGLSVALAVAWDTMLSPVDVRTLTRAQLSGDADGPLFQLARAKTGKAAIGTLSKRTEWLLKAYLETLPPGLHPSAPIFRTRGYVPTVKGGKPRPPVPYTADTLGDDFRDVRSIEFHGDRRQLLDFRRSGAVEAKAGQVDPAALADKMANSIDSNKFLQSTYLPADARVVRLADEARTRGRTRLRGATRKD